jgi:hypothetical protein
MLGRANISTGLFGSDQPQAKTRGVYRPSGLECLAEAVSNANMAVEIPDLATEEIPQQAVRTGSEHEKYDAIGISIFDTQWDTGRDEVKFLLPRDQTMISDVRRQPTPQCFLVVMVSACNCRTFSNMSAANCGVGDCGVAGCGIPSFIERLRRIRSGSERPESIVSDEKRQCLDFAPKRRPLNSNNYSKGEEVFVSTKIGCFEKCFHCPTLAAKFRPREPSMLLKKSEISLSREWSAFHSCMTHSMYVSNTHTQFANLFQAC